MIERMVFQAIKDGVDWFKVDPDRVYEFFLRRMSLTETEARNVQSYFSMDTSKTDQWGGPPNVVHGYPRVSGPFPCFAVVLLSDATQQKYLGDDADDWEDDYEDLDEQVATPLAIYVKYMIEVGLYVPDNPDICVYYYHLLRSILFGKKAAFQAYGLQNVEYSGRDVAPDPRFLPEGMFLRTLTISCEREEVSSEAKGTGTSIGGVYLDDGVTVIP